MVNPKNIAAGYIFSLMTAGMFPTEPLMPEMTYCGLVRLNPTLKNLRSLATLPKKD